MILPAALAYPRPDVVLREVDGLGAAEGGVGASGRGEFAPSSMPRWNWRFSGDDLGAALAG